ncbi:flavoprotein [Psychrobacillus sp. INOP01]|uniref:flavoprotein n=1 Tax=Psychrobacillus sp. INOP01 TaxID=2829187 RepID=UPI001BA85FEE|nr:flavoprotein [Psychrobacillus sp. INOP01]QUG42388.1 flavoprotein [Psychrobacillus sp. INOP01]
MDKTFSLFLNNYLDVWKASSLSELKELISINYEAREITGGDIVDFGYEESVKGWEHGFSFAKENNAQWNINVISILPLRESEIIVVLSATMVIQSKSLDTANLFFQTFRKNSVNDWKLVRSYIEAGIPYVSTNSVLFK